MSGASPSPGAVAIIPARGGSKRIPMKNIRPIAGQPVLSYPVRTALESGLFARVLVSTDHPEIAAVARDWGAEVLERPDHLAGDAVPAGQVVEQVLRTLAAAGQLPEFYCNIYATAVLLRAEDLRGGFRRLEQDAQVDFVLSVSAFPLHPYKAMSAATGYLRPVFLDQFYRPSQEFPDWVAPNGTFLWGRSQVLLDGVEPATSRRAGYRMPYLRAVDMDSPDDFTLAEHLLRMRAG